MKKYIILTTIMVLGVAVGIYGLVQMGSWESEMTRCYNEAKKAETNGQFELAREYYNKTDQAFENRLIWGSIGTTGASAGIVCLLWIFWSITKGERPDMDRVERKQKDRDRQRKEVEDAEGKEDGQA